MPRNDHRGAEDTRPSLVLRSLSKRDAICHSVKKSPPKRGSSPNLGQYQQQVGLAVDEEGGQS
jgi:hypothetical protein